MSNEIEEHENTSTHDEVIQYLTFTLDNEAFATEISRVREVLEYTQITRVPCAPEYMMGVINLRGSVVPVVDLRLQFGMATSDLTVDTRVIIIEVIIDGKTTVLGTLADSVQEVIDLKREQMEPAPSIGTRINNSFISAMGKLDDQFVIILDMNRIFTSDQINDVQKSGKHPAGDKENIQNVA
ncbi:Positive regulator of CheA protein activity (CheW) [hydrothermal vent metagenome]|uniref:Positive regulator of CheA protein activity (CheW) n=1 Tax=hydrothermal vent metagenome TaxID=652676 RepID=A0A3B0X973_9ZZZZ